MVLPIPVALSNTPTDYTIRCRDLIWACAMAQLILAIIRFPLVCLGGTGADPAPLGHTHAERDMHARFQWERPASPSFANSLLEFLFAFFGQATLRDNSIDLNCLLSWGYFGLLKAVLDSVALLNFAANSPVPMFITHNLADPVIKTYHAEMAHLQRQPPSYKVSGWWWNLVGFLNLAPVVVLYCTGALVHSIWLDVSVREERMMREYVAQQRALFGLAPDSSSDEAADLRANEASASGNYGATVGSGIGNNSGSARRVQNMSGEPHRLADDDDSSDGGFSLSGAMKNFTLARAAPPPLPARPQSPLEGGATKFVGSGSRLGPSGEEESSSGEQVV